MCPLLRISNMPESKGVAILDCSQKTSSTNKYENATSAIPNKKSIGVALLSLQMIYFSVFGLVVRRAS